MSDPGGIRLYYVHEVHRLRGGSEQAADAALRDEWAPAIARDPATRLVWCVRSLPGAASFPELITMTAVADAAALGRFSSRLREGDLGPVDDALSAHRDAVTRRILAPLIFDPLEVDLAAIPARPADTDHETRIYIHDFVAPRQGMQRTYEVAMRDVFLKMLDNPGMENRSWAGLETVAGGGPAPESIMITRIGNAASGIRTMTTVLGAEHVVPGSWLYDALALRDTWVSRLVRSVPWSPIS
jgi:hypothetical protein